jgi:hypothetical protein
MGPSKADPATSKLLIPGCLIVPRLEQRLGRSAPFPYVRSGRKWRQRSELKGGIIRAAMALEGTYETKLLRIVIGFLHVSLLQQLAQARHGKAFHTLTQEEKTNLETGMIDAVAYVAQLLSEEALQGGLKPPETIQ